jgi:PEGA domain
LWRDYKHPRFVQLQHAELRWRGASGTPVHVTSVPAGAEVSFGKDSCITPCTLAAPNGTGTYNVSFKLNGYQPQSVPVRIAVNESSSMQTGDAGSAPTTVITPDPVMAELQRFAPTVMKPPAARTKTKPATTAAATSAPPSSPPQAAPPTMPSPLATTER